MLHVILYQPEIPPNTGNIIRLCANAGAGLHLIEPMGFQFTDARLKRAGLDYHDLADIRRYPDWQAFRTNSGLESIWAFSAHAERCYSEAGFEDGDGLLFGPETRGLPENIKAEVGGNRCLKLPMLPGNRSLNLSNTVAVGLYEAWRQLEFTVTD